MDMNRGVIGANGSSRGHVHRLEDLTDVAGIEPEEGAVLMFVNGVWTPVVPVKEQHASE